MKETTSSVDPFALQSEAPPTAESDIPALEGAEPAAANQPPMAWMLLRELVETVVLSLVIFLLIRQVVQNYRIESHSMQPNFQEGQFILVNKLAYKLGAPERGEVVVFHNPSNTDEDYIKRLIGLPGDTLEIHDQQVYVNGGLLPQPYQTNPIRPDETFGPVVVPPDHIFVMGDNRPNSRDSRYPEVGFVSEDLIVGKAWLRVWPFTVFGLVPHFNLQPGAPQAQAPPEPTEAPCCGQGQ